jgi:hypothetical protein
MVGKLLVTAVVVLAVVAVRTRSRVVTA